MSGSVEWDATAYDRVAAPQEAWGREVLERLELRGDETVLDAGCGSGRVTRLLLERLPAGRVIGVDGSRSMIDVARRNLEPFGPRAVLIVSDLLDLELVDPADAVFSTATFHWILDHDRLFGRLFAALGPGGAIEAQCGGEGNVTRWNQAIEAAQGQERFRAHLDAMPPIHNFASVADTEARLARAGFERIRVWLERRTVTPPEPRVFARAVGLAKHLDRLPSELHDDFADAVLAGLPDPLVLEYVRLNISAGRPR